MGIVIFLFSSIQVPCTYIMALFVCADEACSWHTIMWNCPV